MMPTEKNSVHSATEIPLLQTRSYFPSFLEPQHWVETALTAVIQKSYADGRCKVLVMGIGASGAEQI